SAVDLVRQYDVGEHRTGPELELPGAVVVHLHAGDVGGEQVGGELDAAHRGADRAGHRLGQRGLADTGHVLDEEVPFREHAHQGGPNDLGLAPDERLDVAGQVLV